MELWLNSKSPREDRTCGRNSNGSILATHVVMENESVSRQAIAFLKQRQLGREPSCLWMSFVLVPLERLKVLND